MTAAAAFHPVQLVDATHVLPAAVTARAFVVYDALFPGATLAELNRRGGFGLGEAMALLYAASFPRAEWRARVAEARARP